MRTKSPEISKAEPLDEKSVWTQFVTARAARNVARALTEAGYLGATRENCHNYVINIARHFEPGDAQERANLLRLICEAAGIQPRKEN